MRREETFQVADIAWWRAWVAANMAGELLGLGATFVLGIYLFGTSNMLGPLGAAIGAAVLGALVEGLTVGTAQWIVLRRVLRRLPWREWAGATALGAGIAWALAMLPSGLLSGGSDAASGPGISDVLLIVLAVPLGGVLGLLLGGAQWLVLRRYLPQSMGWIAANALAWAVGMAIVFAGTSFIGPQGLDGRSAVALAVTIPLAGATVGAIHGAWLVWRTSSGTAGIGRMGRPAQQ